MGKEFKNKIMLPCIREVECLKCQQVTLQEYSIRYNIRYILF